MLIFSELEVAYLENVETLPSTNLQKGRIVWDDSNTRASIYEGSGWRHLVDHISALSNPMTTAGDIIKAGASGVPERLAIGAANTVLRSNGTVQSWGQISNDNVADLAAIAGSKIAAATDTLTGTISKEYDSGWLTYSETVTWVQIKFPATIVAPSGTTHRYRWIRIGNVVSIWIMVKYATPSGLIQGVRLPLPSAVPAPSIPTGSVIEIPASLQFRGSDAHPQYSTWVHSHTNGTKYIQGYITNSAGGFGFTSIDEVTAFASYSV